MKKIDYSASHAQFLSREKKKTALVIILRAAILIMVFGVWEALAQLKIIDTFLFSSPSRIANTLYSLFTEGEMLKHMSVTLIETFLGFVIATVFGTLAALLLWWSPMTRRVLEPYIVVLNSLPKIALGPIIIVWFGATAKSIIFMAVLITIVVTIITMSNGFLATEAEKELLLRSMGASKLQILIKLVIPSSAPTFMSMLKINVGLAWIGSIMGEYLTSKAGIGYLIVYGGQVFKLDLVMSATVVLCVLAAGMYALVAIIEKIVIKNR